MNEDMDLLIPPDLAYLKTLQPPINLYLSEGLTLCKLASESKYPIVEIGSYMGKSACYMAAGSRIGQKQLITCIDPWNLVEEQIDKRSPEKLAIFARHDIRPKFDKQTERYKDLINPIQGYSVEVARIWDKPIGLIFIDGNHNCVLEDYEVWYPHVITGGLIAFHDIHFTHVIPAIRTIKERKELKNWITINRLAYAQKK